MFVVADSFYIALFAALEQTHSLAYDSIWLTSFLFCFYIYIQCVFEYPPKWCTYSAGMAGATWNCSRLGAFCVHHTAMHHDTSCKATNVRCMRVNLDVTCQLHFWQNDRDLLHATAVTRGMERIPHRKLTLEKMLSRRSCRDSNPRPFNHESGTLTMDL